MKFLCDDNLGKLARYLRMLGYDTFFEPELSDPRLLSVMLKEKRFVFTRDHKIISRIDPENCLLIESDEPDDQLKSVIKKLNLPVDRSAMFSRCLECNIPCDNVSSESIKDQVFPYIIKTKDSFKRCPECGRIFWRGSHYRDMAERLDKIIKK